VKVDLYVRLWLWMATVMIVAFLAAVLIAAGTHAVHPPSHLEVIDPATVLSDSESSSPASCAYPPASRSLSA